VTAQPGTPEQTAFCMRPGADCAPIQSPVQIPKAALRALSTDAIVSDCSKSHGFSPERLPARWFAASIVHLHRADESDLLVMPAMSGDSAKSEKSESGCWDLVKYPPSNLYPDMGMYEPVPFWVLRNTGRGYEVALSEELSTLEILSKRSREFHLIEITILSPDSIGDGDMEYNGKRYVYKE